MATPWAPPPGFATANLAPTGTTPSAVTPEAAAAASKVWEQPDFKSSVTANQQAGSTPSAGSWQSYTVQPGDSWEKIAGTVYGDQRMYEVLQRANADQYGPLQPGQSILLTPGIQNPYVSGYESTAEKQAYIQANRITAPAGTTTTQFNPLTVGTDQTTKAPGFDTTAPIAQPKDLDPTKFTVGQSMYYDTLTGDITPTSSAKTAPLYWDDKNQKLTLDPTAGKAAVFDQTFPYTKLNQTALKQASPTLAFRLADEEAQYNDWRTYLAQNPEAARGTGPLTADEIAAMQTVKSKQVIAQQAQLPASTFPGAVGGLTGQVRNAIAGLGGVKVGGTYTVTNLKGGQQTVGPTPWYQAATDFLGGSTSRITEAVFGSAVHEIPLPVPGVDLASAVVNIKLMASDPVKYFSPVQGIGPTQQTLHIYGQFLKLAGVKELTLGDEVVGVLASGNYLVAAAKYLWAFQGATVSRAQQSGLLGQFINPKNWVDPATGKLLTHNEAVQMQREGKQVKTWSANDMAVKQTQSDWEKAASLLKYANFHTIAGPGGKPWPGTTAAPIKPDFKYNANPALGKEGTLLSQVGLGDVEKNVVSTIDNRAALGATRDHLRDTAYPLLTKAQALDRQIAANPANAAALTQQRDQLMGQAKSQISRALAIDQQLDQSGAFNKYFNYGIDFFPDRKAAFDTALTEAEMQKGAPLSFEELQRIQDVFADPTTELAGRLVFDPLWLVPTKVWDVALTPVKAVLGVALDGLKAIPLGAGTLIDLPIMAGQAILGHDPEGLVVPFLNDVGDALTRQATQSIGRNVFDMARNAFANIAGGDEGTAALFDKNIGTGTERGSLVSALLTGDKTQLGDAISERDFSNIQRIVDRTGVNPEDIPTIIARAKDKAIEGISNSAKQRLMLSGLTGSEAEAEAMRIAQDAVEHPAKIASYIAQEFRQTYMRANMLTPTISRDSILGALSEKFGLMENPRTKALVESIGNVSHFFTRAWQDTVTTLRPAWAFYHTIDSTFRALVFGEGPFGDLPAMWQWLFPDFSGVKGLTFIPAELSQSLTGGPGEDLLRELIAHPDEYKAGPLGFIKREWDLAGRVGDPTDHLVSDNNVFKTVYNSIARGIGSANQGMRDYNGAIQFALRSRLYSNGLNRDMLEMGEKELPRLFAQFADKLPDDEMKAMLKEAGNNTQKLQQLVQSLNRTVPTAKGMVPAWHVLFPPNFDLLTATLPPVQAAILARSVTKDLSEFIGKIEETGRAFTEGDVHTFFAAKQADLIANEAAHSENVAEDGILEVDRNTPATADEIAAKQPSLSQDKPEGTVKFQNFTGEIKPVQDVNTGLHNLTITNPFQRTTELVQNFADAAAGKHIVTDAGEIVTDSPFARIVVDTEAKVSAALVTAEDGVREIHLSADALSLPKVQMRALLQDQVGLVLRDVDEGALVTQGIAKEDYPALFKQFLDHPEQLQDENPAAFRLLNEQMDRNQRAMLLLEGLRNQRIETHFISPTLAKAIEGADPGAEVRAIIDGEAQKVGKMVPDAYQKAGENYASTVGKTFDQIRARGAMAVEDAEVAASTKSYAHYIQSYGNLQRFDGKISDWLLNEPAFGPIGPAGFTGAARARAWDGYYAVKGAIYDAQEKIMRDLGTKLSTMGEDEIDKLPQISAQDIFDEATARVGGKDHAIFKVTTGPNGAITDLKVFNPRGVSLWRDINDPARLKAFASSTGLYDAKSLTSPLNQLIDRPVQEVVKNAISLTKLTDEEAQAARVMWTKQLQKAFNLSDDQAFAVRSMVDLHASQWAKLQQVAGNDVTAAMWYPTHLFGVTSGPVEIGPEWLTQLGKAEEDVPYGLGGLAGQTKSVDAGGLPIEQYHGTRAEFDSFELSRADPQGSRGAGIYFTDDQAHAVQYANLAHARTEDTFKTWQDATDFANANNTRWQQMGGQFRIEQRGDDFVVVHPADTFSHVRTVYLDARNPFDARTMKLTPEQLKTIGWDDKIGAESGDVEKLIYNNPGLQKDLPRAMQQLGYDGYQYPIQLPNGMSAGGTVVWNTKQIVPAQYADASGAARQVFDAAKNSPNLQAGVSTLLQKGLEGEGAIRGATTFMDDGRAFIKSFQSSDMTTVIHELGHIFRRDLPPEDMKVAEDFVSQATGKAVENGVWTRAHEETFANAFEKYVASGEAPTPALKTTFEHLRDWFVMAWKSFGGDSGSEFDLSKIHPDIQLSPEMKGVYSRMFADTQDAAAKELDAVLMTPIDKDAQAIATVSNAWRGYGTNMLTGEGMLTDDSIKLLTNAIQKGDWDGLATADLREEVEGSETGVKVSAERRQEIINISKNEITPQLELDAKANNVRGVLTSSFTNPTDPNANLAIRRAAINFSDELKNGAKGYRYTTPEGEWKGLTSTYPKWYQDMWSDPSMKYTVNKSFYVKDASGVVHKMGVLGKTQSELEHIVNGEDVQSAIGKWLKQNIVDRLLNPEATAERPLEEIADPYIQHLMGDDSLLEKNGFKTVDDYADSAKAMLDADAAKKQALQLRIATSHLPGIMGVTDPATYGATLEDGAEAARLNGAPGDANALEGVKAEVDQLERAVDPSKGFISAPGLPEGTKQYLQNAGNRAVVSMQIQQTLDDWEAWLSQQVSSGAWTLQSKTPEELAAWKEFGDQAVALKQQMLDVANNGGTFAGKTYQGNIPYVNSKMLNYTDYSVFDRNMKSVMPFWMFPSRTIPMWLESIATHPEIAAFYDKYMQTSRRIALQEGAVTATGQQLPSLEGYIPLPGSDGLWIDPLAPFSFRLAFPHRDTDDSQENNTGIVSMVYGYLRDMGSYFGFTFAPWITIPAMAMTKDPSLISPSIVPQADLIPVWAQRSVIEEIRRVTGVNMPDTWTPQVSWKDYLVERRLLADANVYLQGSNLSQADKIAYTAKVQNALQTREGDPLWDSAQHKEELGDYWRRTIQFFTGIQAKPYSDAEVEFQNVRNDIDAQRSAINDQVMANMLKLYGDPEARYAQYNTERYSTDQGALISDYGIISHTTDPTTGDQLYGQPRRDLINQQLDTEAATSSYFNALDANHTWLTGALAKLPIGAGADQTDPIWTQYFAQQQKIENDPIYANATRVWAQGYKPASMTTEHFTQLWWNMLRGTKPAYTPEQGQTYPDYQGEVAAWEASLPAMAKNLYQSFITQNESEISKAQEVVNKTALGVSPSVVTATPSVDIMRLLQGLVKTTSAATYNAYENSQATVYDAINKAWQTMYWDPYWAVTAGKTGYEYDAAQAAFKQQHPSPPTADDIKNWVETNYPNQFTGDALDKSINGTTEATITSREAPKTADSALADEVLNILMMAGPSNTALKNQYTKIAKYPDGWNTWYTSGGNPAAWKNPAEFEKFVLDLKQAAMNLNLQQPDTARLEEMAQAQNLNTEWTTMSQQQFGANIQDLIAARAGLATAALKKAFDVQNPQVKEYYAARDQWAIQQPIWAKYYQATPAATTTTSTKSTSGYYKYHYGGHKAKTAAAPKFSTTTEAREVPRLAYRDLTTNDRLDLAKIGKGGVGGLPTGLAAAVGSEALDDIATSIEGAGPLSQANLDWLNLIAGRHPEWQTIINTIIATTKAKNPPSQNT